MKGYKDEKLLDLLNELEGKIDPNQMFIGKKLSDVVDIEATKRTTGYPGAINQYILSGYHRPTI